MNGLIKSIRLTTEQFENKYLDYEDLNTDVIVHFDDGDEYIATFLSWKNLEEMIKNHKKSGEYFSDQYYKIVNAVVVNDFNKGNLLPVIELMIIEGDFQLVFKKV